MGQGEAKFSRIWAVWGSTAPGQSVCAGAVIGDESRELPSHLPLLRYATPSTPRLEHPPTVPRAVIAVSILGAVSANGYDLRPNDASSLKIGTPRSAPAGGLDAWPVRAPVPPHRVQN